MTKTKVTKKALASSLLALMLCVSMLLGTTYAWFTDSVTSAGNIIKSGTLDVEMWYADGATDPDNTTWTDASTGAIFNYDLWEPGYTEVRHIQIKNVGTLALKYKVQIVANGTVSDLADVIDVYYMDPAEQIADRTALAAKTPMGTLTAALAGMAATASGNLRAGEADTVTIALKMQESAGNEYQNKSIGTDFSVQLLATQYTYEADSFNNQYDAQAEYPVLSVGSAKITSAATEDLTINSVGEIKSATVPSDAANTVFDDMKVDGADSNELTMTLKVAKTGETTTGTGTTVALEIDMDAVMKTTTGAVTTTTTQDVTNFSDYITIEYNLGAGLSDVTATHKGNAMVNSTNTGDDAGYGIYSYDSATGILTIKTRSLSPFTVSYSVAVTGLTLSDVAADMKPADTLQLTATVAPENATQSTVTWTSSDESVATVSDTGYVTAVGGGSATITATAGGVSATCEVSVIPANAIFKLIPNSDPDSVVYLTASQLDGENGLLTNAYGSGNYTLELIKNATIDLAGSGYSNFFSYKFAVGNSAENVTIDLKGYTLTFSDSSYAYEGSYLMAYDCENLTIRNGTLQSTLLGGTWPLFATWCYESVAMDNVTLINVNNNRNW